MFKDIDKRLPLVMAVRSIRNGSSMAQASRIYNVPTSTLWDHIRGKCKDSPKDHRKRTTVLSEKEENALVEYCQLKAKTGLPLRRIDVSKVFLVRLHHYTGHLVQKSTPHPPPNP